MKWRYRDTFIVGVMVGMLFWLALDSHGMDNIRMSVPGAKYIKEVTTTLPQDLHPELKIETITIDKDGVITGITLFHKIKGRWVHLTQQVINGELYMTNDGVSAPYTSRKVVYENIGNTSDQ